MRTETFEVSVMPIEMDSEAIELARELGLNGQLELIEKDDAFPYRKLSETEKLAVEALFPKSKSVREYKYSALPIEILKVIALMGQQHEGHKLCVHYSDEVDQKFLVSKFTPTSTYYEEVYLLGTWGENIRPLAEMVPEAKEAKKALRIDKLTQFAAQIDAHLAAVRSSSADAFFTKSMPVYHE